MVMRARVGGELERADMALYNMKWKANMIFDFWGKFWARKSLHFQNFLPNQSLLLQWAYQHTVDCLPLRPLRHLRNTIAHGLSSITQKERRKYESFFVQHFLFLWLYITVITGYYEFLFLCLYVAVIIGCYDLFMKLLPTI